MSIRMMTHVWENADLSGNDLLCLLALADWGDDNGGNIFPSYDTLARKLRVTRRSAIRIVSKLESHGYIIKHVGAGKYRQNDYSINSDKMSPSKPDSDASVTIDSDASVTHIVTPVSPNTLDNHHSYPLDPPKAPQENLFDDFWAMYPNKVGKGAARTSFFKALKKTSIEKIVAGLDNYINKTDDRPWCNPATWLNQERWGDEPAQAPSQRTQAMNDWVNSKSDDGGTLVDDLLLIPDNTTNQGRLIDHE